MIRTDELSERQVLVLAIAAAEYASAIEALYALKEIQSDTVAWELLGRLTDERDHLLRRWQQFRGQPFNPVDFDSVVRDIRTWLAGRTAEVDRLLAEHQREEPGDGSQENEDPGEAEPTGATDDLPVDGDR